MKEKAQKVQATPHDPPPHVLPRSPSSPSRATTTQHIFPLSCPTTDLGIPISESHMPSRHLSESHQKADSSIISFALIHKHNSKQTPEERRGKDSVAHRDAPEVLLLTERPPLGGLLLDVFDGIAKGGFEMVFEWDDIRNGT